MDTKPRLTSRRLMKIIAHIEENADLHHWNPRDVICQADIEALFERLTLDPNGILSALQGLSGQYGSLAVSCPAEHDHAAHYYLEK